MAKKRASGGITAAERTAAWAKEMRERGFQLLSGWLSKEHMHELDEIKHDRRLGSRGEAVAYLIDRYRGRAESAP